MKIVLVAILIFVSLYLLYLKKTIKGNIYKDKRVLFAISIILPLVAILIQLSEFGNIIALAPILIFAIFAFILNYFWHCMYNAEEIIKSKNIQLDYEPIIWPLYIRNLIQISKKIKDNKLNYYIIRIKIISIFMIVIFITIILIAIFLPPPTAPIAS